MGRGLSAKVLDEPCLRPDDFDLAAHWASAQAEFLGSWQTVPVVVRVQEDRLWLVRYAQDPTRADAALAGASEPDEGWVTLTLQFENEEMAGYDLMRFGDDLEVLEPLAVREAIAARASAMVERYASVPA